MRTIINTDSDIADMPSKHAADTIIQSHKATPKASVVARPCPDCSVEHGVCPAHLASAMAGLKRRPSEAKNGGEK